MVAAAGNRALDAVDGPLFAAEWELAKNAEAYLQQGNRGIYGTTGYPTGPRVVVGFTVDDADYCTLHRFWLGATVPDLQDESDA